MVSTNLRITLLVAGIATLVGTRFPSDPSGWGWISVASGVILLAAAAFAVSPKGTRAAERTVIGGSLSLVLVPTSDDAVMAAFPDWAAAVLLVLAVHVFSLSAATAAPLLGQGTDKPRFRHALLRSPPMLVAAILVVVVPISLAWILPARVHSAYELHGALAPLVPVAFLGTLAAALGVLRSSRWAPSRGRSLRVAKSRPGEEPS